MIPWSEAQQERLEELVGERKTIDEIAKRMAGHSRATLKRRIDAIENSAGQARHHADQAEATGVERAPKRAVASVATFSEVPEAEPLGRHPATEPEPADVINTTAPAGSEPNSAPETGQASGADRPGPSRKRGPATRVIPVRLRPEHRVMLEEVAAESGKDPAEVAASIVAEVLVDDARAHG